MIPIVYINTESDPFVDEIMTLQKVLETRTRDTLRPVLNRPVFIAESGHGPAVIRCMAVFRRPLIATSREDWDDFRRWTRIAPGSSYDWTEDTRKKYMYPVQNVTPVAPFIPPKGIRHGRVWMELDERNLPVGIDLPLIQCYNRCEPMKGGR